ncbi:hypothetical protein [Runella sp.]|uniref:hypothetical protein n=1 Tax=Runella sp. TaxID=1960881 RepID=UPI003D0BB774
MPLEEITNGEWFTADFPSHIDEAPVIDPSGKIVANFTQDAEITIQQKFDRGITHLQYFYDSTFGKVRKCFVMLPDGFGSSTPSDAQINAFADQVATLIEAQSAIGEQFCEGTNAISLGDYYTVGTKFYRRLCEKLATRAFINNFFGTYDSGLANFCGEFFNITGITSRNPLHARFTGALASQAGARKKAQSNDFGNPASPQADDGFYTSGFHEWCNSFTMALFANDGDVTDWFMYWVFEIQRKYAAKTDARTVVYTSPWTQSVLTLINTHSRNPGWYQEAEGGYWLMQNWHVVPFERMRWIGFFGCALADGCFSWESGVIWSKNKANRKKLPTGPGYPSLPVWVSEGGDEPDLPQFNSGATESMYPQYPQCGNDAMTMGAQQFEAIADILWASDGWHYVPHTADGVTVAVQKPEDTRLFRPGVQNWNQDTVLHWANDRKGLMLACHAGNQYAAVYLNSYLTPVVKEDIVGTYNGKTITLNDREGGILHIWRGTL